jgi:hypothetical protein
VVVQQQAVTELFAKDYLEDQVADLMVGMRLVLLLAVLVILHQQVHRKETMVEVIRAQEQTVLAQAAAALEQ